MQGTMIGTVRQLAPLVLLWDRKPRLLGAINPRGRASVAPLFGTTSRATTTGATTTGATTGGLPLAQGNLPK